MNRKLAKLAVYLKIAEEESPATTYNEVKESVPFKGANFWMLMFSMLIACIGLNVNSLTAIIGAMLISPLMGPIVGIFYGLAIMDKNMIMYSVKHWLFAVFFCLLTTTLYFIISPFDFATDMIRSFLKPTLFDCLIAFLGGLVSLLGIYRKDGIKVLAGVAVATSCIPPLATAGFGLAQLNWKVAAGGMYFYLINCVYIGLGTYVLARFLKMKNKSGVKLSTFWNFVLIISSILFLIPSVWLAYRMFTENLINRQTNRFISKTESITGLHVIDHSWKESDKGDTIFLTVQGNHISEEKQKLLQKNLEQICGNEKNCVMNYTDEEAFELKNEMEIMKLKLQKQDSVINTLLKLTE